MRVLVFILIPVGLFLASCGDDRSSQSVDRIDIVVDPWIPYGSANDNDQFDFDCGDNNSRGGGGPDYRQRRPPVSTANDNQPVPEPSTMLLVGSGALFMAILRRRKDGQED